MAKVVFIQYWMIDHIGIMTMTACLKQKGHEACILVKHEEDNFLKKIAEIDPDIVGFTCTTGLHVMALNDAKEIKKACPRILTLMGGSHPTFTPGVIKEDALDIICRGEGEGAILDLCERIDKGLDYADVANLSVKTGGEVRHNELRPLIDNLDILPFPDREHYNRYPILKKMPNRYITTGRGCVYNCTFCSNGSLKSLYKGKGKFIRRRSVSHVINEIKHLEQNYYVKCISFEDDDFLDNHEWIKEFLTAYEKEIKIPYTCLGRFDNVTDEIAALLKSSGCYLVELGIDSGNEEIRQKLLNKSMTTEQIISGAKLLKKNEIKFRAFNILGFPGETINDALETIDLNKSIHTDYPLALIWQPYPETALAKSTFGQQLENDAASNFSTSYISSSRLQQDNIKELENLQKLFPIFVRIPFSKRFIKKILKLHLMRPCYDILFKLNYLYDVCKVYRVNVFCALDWGWRMRKLYS